MGSIANKHQAVGCAVLGLLAVVGVLVVGLALLAIGDGGEPAAVSGGGPGLLDKPPTIACEVGDACDLGEPTVTVTGERLGQAQRGPAESPVATTDRLLRGQRGRRHRRRRESVDFVYVITHQMGSHG